MAKVLIVDDVLFMRMILKKLLLREGHEIIGEATTGPDAIEEYIKCQPDIILLDMHIPDMNGLKVIKTLMRFNSSVKIIMISANQTQTLMELAISIGAKGFIIKPFQSLNMINEINRVLEL